MLFILLHHFIVHGSEFVTAPSVWLTIMNSFLVIAVDCFVLISGYFGIKAKWIGFIHLYVLCAFYSVFLTLFSFYETGQFSIKEFLFSFLVFSNSKWWFIQCYVYLFILSPILNIVIDSISKNRKVFIALLLIGSSLISFMAFVFVVGKQI